MVKVSINGLIVGAVNTAGVATGAFLTEICRFRSTALPAEVNAA